MVYLQFFWSLNKFWVNFFPFSYKIYWPTAWFLCMPISGKCTCQCKSHRCTMNIQCHWTINVTAVFFSLINNRHNTLNIITLNEASQNANRFIHTEIQAIFSFYFHCVYVYAKFIFYTRTCRGVLLFLCVYTRFEHLCHYYMK